MRAGEYFPRPADRRAVDEGGPEAPDPRPRRTWASSATPSTTTLVQVLEPYKDPRFNAEPDKRTGFVTRNLLSA